MSKMRCLFLVVVVLFNAVRVVVSVDCTKLGFGTLEPLSGSYSSTDCIYIAKRAYICIYAYSDCQCVYALLDYTSTSCCLVQMAGPLCWRATNDASLLVDSVVSTS